MFRRSVMGPKSGTARPSNEIGLVPSSTLSLCRCLYRERLVLHEATLLLGFLVQAPYTGPTGTTPPRPGRQQVAGTQSKVEHAKGHHADWI